MFKHLYGLITNRFGVGGLEFTEELDITEFALKSEPVGIVRKHMKTKGLAEMVLMRFYMLGKNNSLCRSDRCPVLVCELAPRGQSTIYIPLDTGMERKDHVCPYLMPDTSCQIWVICNGSTRVCRPFFLCGIQDPVSCIL